uniref:protein mono-ADP-ribosyltransferase PARP10 isoform X1 n=3 Tax=Jaculus jaculus TaxID=51337 RepID=UPI001E1B4DF8|nr:protein mono-ADP-ribosyltransferase PARP10 isoform X1 [Jaculus jaculus]
MAVMAKVETGAAVELQGLPPDVPDELLTLYFENRRRSGGGPVLSWQRLGCGGILTFQEPADAERVLAQAEHRLHGARLSLRSAPPRAPARVLLQGLPPGTSPLSLEQHVQTLLRATGHPIQACRALDSPRQDRALVQLSMPLSEAEVHFLEEQARNVGLDGASVSVTWVPQTQAVRVVASTPPVDMLLLELYMESERRSGGGTLEGLRNLPRQLGTVVSFQQWQVAERVLQQDHWLNGFQLSLVPHYDVLEPEELAEGSGAGDHPTTQSPGAIEHTLQGAGGLAEVLIDVETLPVDPEEAPEQLGASLRANLVGTSGQAVPVDSGSMGSLEQDRPISLGIGSPEQSVFMSQGLMESADSVGPVESFTELLGQVMGPGSPEVPGQEGLVEMVVSMEPGAMRFLQLYHEDLLTSLDDIALFPLEGMDVAGFQLCGARVPCQAAQELLQSLLGSISCHMLRLKHPGSARFLLGMEGQHLLQGLEAQFQCVFVTDHLASAILNTDSAKVDLTEAFQVLSSHSDQENTSLEEVRKLLTTLEVLDGEDCMPPELGEKDPEEQPEEEALPGLEKEKPTPEFGEEPVAPSTRASGWLEEEVTLQLAIHQSLDPQGQVAEQEEATALRQALALSLLEQPLLEAKEPLDGSIGGRAQLVVHAPFEQDMDELDKALATALEAHFREETVNLQGRVLPAELWARLEQCHGVSVALHGDCIVLHGFGAQPARAARHLTALLLGPKDQSLAFPSSNTLSGQSPKGPMGRLEGLAQSTEEFQEVVQAFYNTLDTSHGRICIIRVERVLNPLLQQQYQLHRELMVQRCEQRQAEQVLYHGTSAAAVSDICAHGFNRSYCGRNGTLYGKGVYFAKRASLSVQDRYSPPDADGHKAVFVARVLTGDYGQGSRSLRAPPLRPSGQLLRYDSAVDCLHQPSIFVIFHDTQALPTHLITCKNMPRASPESSFGFVDPSLDT